MINPKKVLLTGGLGNQLFQYTLSLLLQSEVQYLDFVAPNRRNEIGQPDICDFLDSRVMEGQFLQIDGFFKRKLLNLAIRTSAEKQKSFIFKRGLEKTLTITIFENTKFSGTTYISEGLGFDNRSLIGDLFIGYFQSYKYLEILTKDKLTLELVRESALLKHYEELSKEDSPLVVHYRLGDYLQESSFGLPSEKYYVAAINRAMHISNARTIWVFSDQVELAMKLFPVEFRSIAKFIDTKDASSAETLQIMRLGTAYVIANSSFSWWAAALSRKSNPIVICPSPWFATGSTPNQLFPPDWEVLDRVTGDPDTAS